MSYDDDFEDGDFELPPVVDEPPVRPPEEMKLTVEVALQHYDPHGLLQLIATGLLRDIGGRDKWRELLSAYLLRLGKDRAGALVTAEVERIFAAGVSGLDLGEMVRAYAEGWMQELVNAHDGNACTDSYYRKQAVPRLQWIVGKLVKEAMDAAWKQAEGEWKARTQAAIKATLTEAMAERLARALPTPAELRS